jgi:hypothetical protein
MNNVPETKLVWYRAGKRKQIEVERGVGGHVVGVVFQAHNGLVIWLGLDHPLA